jgi:hypothetical protein
VTMTMQTWKTCLRSLGETCTDYQSSRHHPGVAQDDFMLNDVACGRLGIVVGDNYDSDDASTLLFRAEHYGY